MAKEKEQKSEVKWVRLTKNERANKVNKKAGPRDALIGKVNAKNKVFPESGSPLRGKTIASVKPKPRKKKINVLLKGGGL